LDSTGSHAKRTRGDVYFRGELATRDSTSKELGRSIVGEYANDIDDISNDDTIPWCETSRLEMQEKMTNGGKKGEREQTLSISTYKNVSTSVYLLNF
jgi:hypothetical protein